MPHLAPERPVLPHAISNPQNKATDSRDSVRPASPDPGTRLHPRQLAAINLLFAGASFMQVCRHLRVDRKTLYRWRRSAGFIAEIRRRYGQHVVARKPRAPRDPLIPPAQPIPRGVAPRRPTRSSDAPRRSERTSDDAIRAAFVPGGPLPPETANEPFWLKEIRRSRAAYAAEVAARQREHR